MLGTRPEFLEFPLNRDEKEQIFFGAKARVSKVSLALEQPRFAQRCNLRVVLEQEIFLRLSGPRPKRLLPPSPLVFWANPGILGADIMQSGIGVNFYFGPANFWKIAGEFLSEF